MKKSITTVFITILIIALGVSGFFTYKYFDLINQEATEETTISKTESQSLIYKACVAMGFIKSSSTSKNSLASTLSISYDDYTEENVDFFGKADFIKAFLMSTKFILDGEAEENTFYKSRASYGSFDAQEMRAYYLLNKNNVEVHLFDNSRDIEIVLKLVKSDIGDDSWTLHIYGDYTQCRNDRIVYTKVTGKGEKATSFSIVQYTLLNDVTDPNNLSTADIGYFSVYECDIINHKKLYVGAEALTDQEVLLFAKNAYLNNSNQLKINFSNNINYKKTNFLKLLYEYLEFENVQDRNN